MQHSHSSPMFFLYFVMKMRLEKPTSLNVILFMLIGIFWVLFPPIPFY